MARKTTTKATTTTPEAGAYKRLLDASRQAPAVRAAQRVYGAAFEAYMRAPGATTTATLDAAREAFHAAQDVEVKRLQAEAERAKQGERLILAASSFQQALARGDDAAAETARAEMWSLMEALGI